MLISVVMPVYNAQAFLSRSIGSVLKQTYENWELLCVNDGSKDDSLSVLKKYAEKDSRIHIFDQKNGGVAAARKTAYQAMSGEYAYNIDADDEISEDLLEKCVDKALATGADIIVPNLICEITKDRSFDWNSVYGYDDNTVFSGIEAFSRTFIPPTMHGCLMWRSSLLKKYACGSDQKLLTTFSEDEYYRRVLYLNCNKVVFCGGYYTYKANEESVTKKFRANQVGYLTICRQMIQLKETYDIPEKVQHLIQEDYLRTAISLRIKLYAYGNQLNVEERRHVRKEIKNAYNDAWKYRKNIHFADKSRPYIYKLASLSGYPMFCLTCYLMSRKKYV